MKLVFDAKHVTAIVTALLTVAVAFNYLPQSQADAIMGIVIALVGAFVGTPGTQESK